MNIIKEKTDIICVLGMHRSGSSVTAQVLHENGVAIGPRLIGQTKFNKKGHFEDRFVVTLNKKILRFFNGTWQKPPQLPEDWLNTPYIGQLIDQSKKYKSKEIDRHKKFLVKDPRLCLTLPFWQKALGEMRYVVVLRRPHSCTKSILRRNHEFLHWRRLPWRIARFFYHHWLGGYESIIKLNQPTAMNLWYTYYDQLLTDLSKEDKFFILTYEDLLNSPEETIQSLIRWLYGYLPEKIHNVVEKRLNTSGSQEGEDVLKEYQEKFRGIL